MKHRATVEPAPALRRGTGTAGGLSAIGLLVGIALLLLFWAAPAQAAPVRPALPATVGSAHFLVHYDPQLNAAADLEATLGRLELAYSRLVGGAGGAPNAGLPAPVPDGGQGGDDRVDVYVASPGTGLRGLAATDAPAAATPQAGYILAAPEWPDVAWHEFVHVLQFAYGVPQSSYVEEVVAQWSLYWVEGAGPARQAPLELLPDGPFTSSSPVGCPTSTVNADPMCVYDQWPVIAYGVRRYGIGFVDQLLRRSGSATEALDATIRAMSGGRDSLAGSFSDFVGRLWDPSWWTATPAVAAYLKATLPFGSRARASLSAARAGTAWRRLPATPFLAARYAELEIKATARQGDAVRILIEPHGTAPTVRALVRDAAGALRRDVAVARRCGKLLCATVPLVAGAPPVVYLAVINDAAPRSAAATSERSTTVRWRAELRSPAGR